MTPTPVVTGLMLCDHVIYEEGTGKVSPIGIFNRLRVDKFPSTPIPFWVFAMLTDGLGMGKIKVVVTQLETGIEVLSRGSSVYFQDRLYMVNQRVKLTTCSFPAPGWYSITLSIDGVPVADRRLEILLQGASHD